MEVPTNIKARYQMQSGVEHPSQQGTTVETAIVEKQ